MPLGEPGNDTAWREPVMTSLGVSPLMTPLGVRPVMTQLGARSVMMPLGEPSNDAAWRGQYLRRLTADTYPYRWLDTNAPPSNKKDTACAVSELSLCIRVCF